MEASDVNIWILDDDPAIRASLDSLLRGKGFRVQTLKSAREFLNSAIPDEPGCLLLDIRMPERSRSAGSFKAGQHPYPNRVHDCTWRYSGPFDNRFALKCLRGLE